MPGWSAEELKQILQAERAGRPFLVWHEPTGQLRMLGLVEGQRLTIGRRSTSDVALVGDERVSRLHAVLERWGEEWTLSDGGLSRNGTFVNGEPVHERRRLADGDLLRFGDTVIEFRDPVHITASATAPGSDVALVEGLTPTQRRILAALCRPYRGAGEFQRPATNAEIATEVYLGIDAVKAHLRVLYVRFGLTDLPQHQKRSRLALAALRSGIVPNPGGVARVGSS